MFFYVVIIKAVRDGNYSENNFPFLFCEATGVPVPRRISWYFNNTKLNSNGKYNEHISIHSSSIINALTISKLSSYDAGTYTCKATNTAGSVTSSGTVTVLGKQ